MELDNKTVVPNARVESYLDQSCPERTLDLSKGGLLLGVVAGATAALLRPGAAGTLAARVSRSGGVGLFTGATTASTWCVAESFRHKRDCFNAAIGGASGAAFMGHIGFGMALPNTLWMAAIGGLSFTVFQWNGWQMKAHTEKSQEQYMH